MNQTPLSEDELRRREAQSTAAPPLWLAPSESFDGLTPAVGRVRVALETAGHSSSAEPAEGAARPDGSFEGVARSILQSWHQRPRQAAVRRGFERCVEFDDYFGVCRFTDTAPSTALADAAVVAYYRFCQNSCEGHSLTRGQIDRIREAFELIRALTGGEQYGISALPQPSMGASGGRVDALRRWKVGHHTFFVLIQTLLLLNNWLRSALEAGDIPAACEALAVGARLWLGTTEAFRYTGDFLAEDYANVVRPSMSPPNLREGFSGFFSSDHAYLIRTLKSLQRPLEELRPRLGQAHAEYLRGLDSAYLAHACVCEVFVGESPSLRAMQADRALRTGPAFLQHTLRPRALAAAGGRPYPPSSSE